MSQDMDNDQQMTKIMTGNILDLMKDFRREYDDKGPDDLLSQVPYLSQIAERYLEKACSDPSVWTNFVRAHALFNSCAVRDNLHYEQWHDKIYQVEEMYFKTFTSKHPLSLDSHRDLTDRMRLQLEDIREKTKNDMKAVSEITRQFSAVQDGESSIYETMYWMTIQRVSRKCRDEMKEFASQIINESLKLMGESPPCSMAAVALGSMARGEMTPYSDLEYLFLIENDVDIDYFRRLAIVSYFLIGNLGETRLRYMNVDELESDNRWFNDKAKNGFKIDGLGLYAGNIPTGNGITAKTFIKTPSQLYFDYKQAFEHPETNKEVKGFADLSDILSSTELFYYHGDGFKLFTEFEIRLKNLRMNDKRFDHSVKILKEDATKYNFLPRFELSHDGIIEVKTDLYRYASIVLNDLKLVCEITARDTWDMIDTLSRMYCWKVETSHAIKMLVAIAQHIRIECYLFYNSQQDRCSVHKGIDSNDQNLYRLPRHLFHLLAAYLFPMKKATNSFTGSTRSHISNFLGNIVISRDDRLSVIYTHGYCMEWRQCVEKIREKYGNDEETIMKNITKEHFDRSMLDMIYNSYWATKECGMYASSLQFAVRMKELLVEVGGPRESLATTYSMIGRLHQTMGKYSEALYNYNKAMQLKHSIFGEDATERDLANSYSEMASLSQARGLNDDALENYEKALNVLLTLFGKNNANPEIASCYNSMGEVYQAMGKYSDALHYYEKGLQMRLSIYGKDTAHPDVAISHNNIGQLYYAMQKYDAALENYEKSIQMSSSVHGDNTAHPDLAGCYGNMGRLYQALGTYDTALDYYKKALQMYLAIYGENAAHPHLATSYSSLGRLYRAIGENDESLTNYKKALQIRLCIHGENSVHPDLMISYNNIGWLYLAMGKHSEALVHCKKALQMYLTMYGENAESPNLAAAYTNIGRIYQGMKQYDEALQNYSKGLQIRLSVYGPNTPHTDVAGSYNNIGQLHQASGRYSEAMEFYSKALQIYLAVYGENGAHPDLATVYHGFGTLYKAMENYREALNNFAKSLQMNQLIFGQDSTHPNIELCKLQIMSLYLAMGKQSEASTQPCTTE